MPMTSRPDRRPAAPVANGERLPVVSTPEGRQWFDMIEGERGAFHVRSDEVGGRYAILETVEEPGTGVPRHTHREDEIFLVREGAMTFVIGGRTLEAGPGTTLVAPAGVEHAWRNRSDAPVRIILILSPGGADALLAQIGGRRPDELAELAESYGTVVTGPPLAG